MGRTPPCVGPGDRCYGAPSPPERGLRRANFPLPRTTSSSQPQQRIGGSTPPLFHICGRRCGRKSAGEAFTLVVSEERLWSSCVGVLRTRVPEAAWQNCFGLARPVALEGTCLVLSVPSVLARQRIEARYLDVLRATLAEVGGASYDVRLEVSPEARADAGTGTAADTDLEEDELGAIPAAPQSPAANTSAERRADELPVNPRYTFEAFVIGASNRFAHAAALSVAETPAKSYNPLFIYGAAGLGKTHLLHAIANYIAENYPGMRVRYVSTETFMNEFVDAIRTNAMPAFKRRYRDCDVLLVDDVQFMENKEGLQEEFFHTFNTLHGAGRQIVISSDRPPRAIATLEVRLRSRFEWGLITDVQPPELETRLAILRKKAEGERAQVPDEVLDYIATNITDNIRELEGALIRVSAYASLTREPLTRGLAERVLGDLISPNEPRQITPRRILDATSEMFGFTIDELAGKSRSRPLVTARQIGMYVFRELTDFSYPAIAREFGGRDHTTVIHAVEKISTQMKERRVIYDQVTELIHRIKGGPS
ncbi:MAG: chromosomal replication initiator protein DnaA [Acidimicrobiia bacterium]|nr:chromosomal replication initiator protein DnaA [Acidimicrobiia bacterium]